MYATDADVARRKVPKHHKKVGWPSQCMECPEPATRGSPVPAMLPSRPRSATPTMHDHVVRDCHRARVPPEESSRVGHVGGGRDSPYRQPGGSSQRRQHEGIPQRSQSSDHHRPIVQAVTFSFIHSFISPKTLCVRTKSSILYSLLRGTVVERRSLTGESSVLRSCARPAADG